MWLRRVRGILVGAGFTVEERLFKGDLKTEIPFSGPTVLHWQDLRDLPSGTHQIRPPLVLLTGPDPRSLRLAARLQPQEVLLVGEEELLPAKLKFLARTPILIEIHDSISLASHLSPLTRAALRVVFRPETDPAWADSGRVPVKRSSELARAVRVSPDHLSRVAKENGIDLRFVMDAALVIRALRLHELSRPPWEQVAWHLGYSSASGLDALFNRPLEHGPREATEEDALRLRNALVELLRAG